MPAFGLDWNTRIHTHTQTPSPHQAPIDLLQETRLFLSLRLHSLWRSSLPAAPALNARTVDAYDQFADFLTSKRSCFASPFAGSFPPYADMYKNQLQELAQRSCFNLPSYACIREGPDHAPRFKATVSFNGEVFESPGYHTTLRQAEHAAAEVALNILSRRGPTQSLAARILDETGVCKNLLQETAQRAGFPLPVYTTVRSGRRHFPQFTCMVEVGSRSFIGEPANTKKQAEKNAAMAAWSALKHLTPASPFPLLLDSSDSINVGSHYGREEQASLRSSSISGSRIQRSRVRSVNVRDKNRIGRDGNASSGGLYYPSTGAPSIAATDACPQDGYRFKSSNSSLPVSGESSHDAGQKFLYNNSPFVGSWHHQHGASGETMLHGRSARTFYNPQALPGSFSSRRQAGSHHRRHSLSGAESPALIDESMAFSHASISGSMLARASPYQQQIRGLPYQSLSERFELNRPSLFEELQLKDDEDDWSQLDVMASSAQPPCYFARRTPWQSQSERFEHRNHFLPQVEEAHAWDEEEWSPGECYGHLDREQGLENMSSYKEGWLRGNTLVQILEAQKNHGYREGWLREEIKRKNLNENRHAYRESWHDGEAPKFGIEDASCSNRGSRNTQSNILFGEKERSLTYRDSYNDTQIETKTNNSPSTIPSTPSSPFSSFWAKSTQWLGSYKPSSPSSAAAALADTLGLRPASSMAPAVRVRQMVPVCSALPPRQSDALPSAPRAATDHHHSSSLTDSAATVNQLLNSLRL